jgi:hypothetical protein
MEGGREGEREGGREGGRERERLGEEVLEVNRVEDRQGNDSCRLMISRGD